MFILTSMVLLVIFSFFGVQLFMFVFTFVVLNNIVHTHILNVFCLMHPSNPLLCWLLLKTNLYLGKSWCLTKGNYKTFWMGCWFHKKKSPTSYQGSVWWLNSFALKVICWKVWGGRFGIWIGLSMLALDVKRHCAPFAWGFTIEELSKELNDLSLTILGTYILKWESNN